MSLWIVLSIVLAALAIAVPLVMKAFKKPDEALEAERRAKQRAVLEEVERALAPLLSEEHRSEPLRIGPGSEFHENYLKARKRIRYEFRPSTGISFDREIGYFLGRPGTVNPSAPKIVEEVKRGLQVLRHEIES